MPLPYPQKPEPLMALMDLQVSMMLWQTLAQDLKVPN
jgi:hypothetical protein